jgi:hypothetical protein
LKRVSSQQAIDFPFVLLRPISAFAEIVFISLPTKTYSSNSEFKDPCQLSFCSFPHASHNCRCTVPLRFTYIQHQFCLCSHAFFASPAKLVLDIAQLAIMAKRGLNLLQEHSRLKWACVWQC